jgi:hypothetical protein
LTQFLSTGGNPDSSLQDSLISFSGFESPRALRIKHKDEATVEERLEQMRIAAKENSQNDL